jgi:hypothetical protein
VADDGALLVDDVSIFVNRAADELLGITLGVTTPTMWPLSSAT